MTDDSERYQQHASRMHAVAAYLRLYAPHDSMPDPERLKEWNAVYGTDVFNFGLHAWAGQPLTEELIGALGEQVSREASAVLDGFMTAHLAVELRLVELLARATGQSVEEVADGVQAWVSNHGELEEQRPE